VLQTTMSDTVLCPYKLWMVCLRLTLRSLYCHVVIVTRNTQNYSSAFNPSRLAPVEHAHAQGHTQCHCCQLVSVYSMHPESSHIQSSSLFTFHRGRHLHRCVTSSMMPLLGYRPSILRHSLQSQGISTTSLYPPA